MTDPVQTLPAGTPPAVPPAQGGQIQPQPPNPTPAPANNPGNNQQLPPAQNPPAVDFILNQEQFNQRWGEKMAALEKELGMPLKDIKPLVEASKKPPAPAPSNDPLSGAELRLAKMEALMLAGVPSKKIPGLLSRVQGKSKAEIEADIQQMVADGFLVIGEPAPAVQPQQPPTPTPTPHRRCRQTACKVLEIPELRLARRFGPAPSWQSSLRKSMRNTAQIS